MENAGPRTTVQVRLGYGFADLEPMRRAFEGALLPLLGAQPRVSGSITRQLPGSDLEEVTQYDACGTFFDALARFGDESSGWWLNVDGEQQHLGLSGQRTSVQASLAASPSKVEAVREALEAFQATSGLKKIVPSVPPAVVALKGEQHRYYTREPITKLWLQTLVGIVARHEAKDGRFYGTLTTASRETTNAAFDGWVREVEAQWDQVKRLYGSWSESKSNRTIFIDLDLQMVTLTLQAAPEMQALPGLRLEDYVAELGLYPMEADAGYRFARNYSKKPGWQGKQRGWQEEDDRKVAQAIRNCVKVAFGAERITVQSASFIEGGKAEKQVVFRALEEFLEHLRAEGSYQTANLSLSGPRGRSLNFTIQPRERRVRLGGVVTAPLSSEANRAALYEKQVNAITEPFTAKGMGLELIDREAAPVDGGRSERAKEGGISPWVGTLVTGLVLAVVAALLGANGLQSLKPTLEITSPVSAASGKVAVTGDQLPIRWTVTTRRFLHADETKDLPATVLLRQRSAPYGLTKFGIARTGDLVRFEAPGTYDVTVQVIVNGSAWERSFEAAVTR